MKNLLAATLVLFAGYGCATGPGRVADARCVECGTVRAVDLINQGDGRTSGAGALMGAVIGGVVGHQFGSGRGQDAATAAGAVGGAMAGNAVERQNTPGSFYRITIDMDNGRTESVNVIDPAGLVRGSRVRVAGRNLERIG